MSAILRRLSTRDRIRSLLDERRWRDYNVLGVAGAANGHTGALVLGLTLSVVLMGVGASYIAGIINRHRWIGYVGLALIVFVACRMVLHGF